MKKLFSMFSVLLALLLSVSTVVSAADASYGTETAGTEVYTVTVSYLPDDVLNLYGGTNAVRYRALGGNMALNYEYDAVLEKVALQRAAEIAVSYSHTRPNGKPFSSAFPSGYRSFGENIYAGKVGNEVTAQYVWERSTEAFEGQNYRSNLISTEFRSMGAAHIYAGGYHYLVIEFGAPASENYDIDDKRRKIDIDIEADSSSIKALSIALDSTSIELDVGQTAELPGVSLGIAGRNYKGETGVPARAKNAVYTSGAPEIAAVSGSSIRGVSPGSTVVTVTAGGLSAAVNVVVKGSVTPEPTTPKPTIPEPTEPDPTEPDPQPNNKFLKEHRFSFANSSANFRTSWSNGSYYITDSDLKKLINYVKRYEPNTDANSTVSRIQHSRNSSWGGSCFGMAAASILDYENKIGFNENFAGGAKTLYDVPSPNSSNTIMSAINYYYLSQNINFIHETSHSVDKNDSNWSIGLKNLVSTAQKNEPFLFCYLFYRSGYMCGHAIVGYEYKKADNGNHVITVYDNRYPNRDLSVVIDKNYSNCVLKTPDGDEQCVYVEYYPDMSVFDRVDIDGPNNDMNLRYDSYTYNDSSDIIEVTCDGNIEITNDTGKNISIKNGSVSGSTMDIISKYHIINSTSDGSPAPSSVVLRVAKNKSYTFESDKENIDVSVKTNNMFASASAKNSDTIVIGANEGVYIMGENMEYSATLSSRTDDYDTIELNGSSKSDVAVKYDDRGNITASGVAGGSNSVRVYSNITAVEDLTVDSKLSSIVVKSGADGFYLQDTSSESDAISVHRMGGSDRYDTANIISRGGWTQAGTVIVASGESYPDALAGAPLAKALNAPILLTGKTAISRKTLDQISSLGASDAVILGGTAAVSEAVEASLKSNGLNVSRIYGVNRNATAAEIAYKVTELSGQASEGKAENVFLVSNVNFADALSVSPVAAIKQYPILYLSADGTIPTETMDALSNIGAKHVTIIGGPAAINTKAEDGLRMLGIGSERIYGNDRYLTSVKVYESFKATFSSPDIAIATGKNFPDALAGAAFAASKDVPIFLVGGSASSALKEKVKASGAKNLYVFGASDVIPDRIIGDLTA